MHRRALPMLVITLLLVGCTSSPWAAQAPPCAQELGARVYRQACASCHDTGAAGAQVIGDRPGWSSRIAKGMETLVRHSIEGFTGAVGDMPPRGGNSELSDSEVEAAVCYLVEMSR